MNKLTIVDYEVYSKGIKLMSISDFLNQVENNIDVYNVVYDKDKECLQMDINGESHLLNLGESEIFKYKPENNSDGIFNLMKEEKAKLFKHIKDYFPFLGVSVGGSAMVLLIGCLAFISSPREGIVISMLGLAVGSVLVPLNISDFKQICKDYKNIKSDIKNMEKQDKIVKSLNRIKSSARTVEKLSLEEIPTQELSSEKNKKNDISVYQNLIFKKFDEENSKEISDMDFIEETKSKTRVRK